MRTPTVTQIYRDTKSTGLQASTFIVEANKEVIICGGAINTPQLLMLSGIGPSSHIGHFGITPLVDLPAVGQHLVDHPRVSNQFGVANAADDLTDTINRNTTLFNSLLQQWKTNRTGAMSSIGSSQVGWFRLPESDAIWKTEQDPSAGPTSPHYELLFRAS